MHDEKALRHEARILQEKLDDHTLSANQHDAYRHRLQEIRDTLAGNSKSRMDALETYVRGAIDELRERVEALEARTAPKKEPKTAIYQEAKNAVKVQPEVKEVAPLPPSEPSAADLLL